MKLMVIIEDGTVKHYLDDKLHRIDGPAVIYENGTTYWLQYGKHHRVDGPAIEWQDGLQAWYIDDLMHRIDGPALVGVNHSQWYLRGILLKIPDGFDTMEAFIEKLNVNEKYSLQWISDIRGVIELIKNPSDKQTRLHAMRWKI